MSYLRTNTTINPAERELVQSPSAEDRPIAASAYRTSMGTEHGLENAPETANSLFLWHMQICLPWQSDNCSKLWIDEVSMTSCLGRYKSVTMTADVVSWATVMSFVFEASSRSQTITTQSPGWQYYPRLKLEFTLQLPSMTIVECLAYYWNSVQLQCTCCDFPSEFLNIQTGQLCIIIFV
jgi:hypothetical protein